MNQETKDYVTFLLKDHFGYLPSSEDEMFLDEECHIQAIEIVHELLVALDIYEEEV